jgi:glycosyltransferase involved in cell wall biosynthesis
MKVLLSDTHGNGGASTFVGTLARGLSDRGHTADVVVGYRVSSSVDDYRPFVRHVYEPPHSFLDILTDGDYDIVHITEQDLSPPFDYPRRARRARLNARIVATVHAQPVDVPAGADWLCFVAESQRQACTSFQESSTSVIPNGVDPERVRHTASVQATTESRPLAVWVGRTEEGQFRQKDFLGFAFAIESLRRAGWRVLVLDGAPPTTEYPVGDQIRRWFGSDVQYANQVHNEVVLRALADAATSGGAFVSTSRKEAHPFIALEAAALGCPIVAPAIPAFVPFEDRGLASTYTSLAGLLNILEQRSFHAPASVPAEWTARAMTDSYVRIYEDLLGNPRQSRPTDVPARLLLRLASSTVIRRPRGLLRSLLR